MRPDLEDESMVWMHTGDEGIIDEEGYLRSMYNSDALRGADLNVLQLWVESRYVPDLSLVQNE